LIKSAFVLVSPLSSTLRRHCSTLIGIEMPPEGGIWKLVNPKMAIGSAMLAAWWFMIVLPANTPGMRLPDAWSQGRTAIVVGPSTSIPECNWQAQSIKRRFPAAGVSSCFEADSIQTSVPNDLAPSEPLAP
jgi:hypothetical protein